MRTSKVSDKHLVDIRDICIKDMGGLPVSSYDIKKKLLEVTGVTLDDSTIRGRLNAIDKQAASNQQPTEPQKQASVEKFVVGDYVESISDKYKVTKAGWKGEVIEVGVETITVVGEGLTKGPARVTIDDFKKIAKPTPPGTPIVKVTTAIPHIDPELVHAIPEAALFSNYVERPIDKRLGLALDIGKHPMAQGKQGTGKTYSYMYYAHKRGLPFFLFSGFEDFKLSKLFGDKTIENGTIKFQESMFVKATQSPSMILFDEVNAISNANTFDFHALLQNRELFIKDADNGKGKTYKLHPECKIGFAQNPKSAKYIGGTIKPSNFLGRCVYVTFPEFTKKQLSQALEKKYPTLIKDDREKFLMFYTASCEAIDKANVPVDISIRQLINVIDLWIHGSPLKDALNDGVLSIFEAASQPKCKEAFTRIADMVWKNTTPTTEMGSFIHRMMRR